MTRAFSVLFGTRPVWQTPPELPPAEAGVPVAIALSAADASAYTLAGGELPDGLELSGSGLLSGAPGRGGDYTFSVSAQGEVPQAGAVRVFSLFVGAAPVWRGPEDLDFGEAGERAGDVEELAALDAAGAARFELAAGQLPDGVALGEDGVLAGSPLSAGSSAFTVRALDASGRHSSTRAFRAVSWPPPRWPTADRLQRIRLDLEAGAPAAVRLPARGADALYIVSGDLPEGLVLERGGVLRGTPARAGDALLTVRGSAGAAHRPGAPGADVALLLRVGSRPVWSTAPALEVRGRASVQLEAAGAASFSAAGALPSGLTLSETGLLRGVPAAAGPTAFTVRAAGALPGLTATRDFELTHVVPPAFVADPVLPPLRLGRATSLLLRAEHATGHALAPGSAAPPGLELSAGGALEGSPASAGVFVFTVVAHGRGGASAERAFTIAVFDEPSVA